MRIDKYEETFAKLKVHLVDYLEENGIQARNGRHFRCLNSRCEDKDGDDMSVHPDGHVFHCFACKLSGTIVMAAHLIEGKPISGGGFITDNFLYLCNRYGIQVTFEEMDDSDRYELDVYNAYAMAGRIIGRFHEHPIAVQAVADRGWTLDFCRRHMIGTVESFESFRDELRRMFPAKFIDEIDLGKRSLFNENSLIFTVKDEDGRPVGFAARDLLCAEKVKIWEENGRRGRKPPKYINTTTSGVQNIYRKSSRLYGLNHHLRTREGPETPLIIVEGYADWASAVFSGMENVAALAGTAFTREHLSLLRKKDVRQIVLCLDPDAAGEDSVASLLLGRNGKEGILSGVSGMRIEVLSLPDNRDPDRYIQEAGVEAFRALPTVEAFKWILNRFEEGVDPVEVCNKTLPAIVAETNLVRRDQMCRDLAAHTGIAVEVLHAEKDRLLDVQEADLDVQRNEIVKNALRDATRHPESCYMILREAVSAVEGLGAKASEASFSSAEVVDALDSLKKTQESRNGIASGYRLTKFKELEERLNGSWRKDVLMVLGGRPNDGKSALMSELSRDIAQSNPEDTIVIFHTIDDTRPMIMNRWLVQLSYDEGQRFGFDVTMNKMEDPNFYLDRSHFDDEHRELGRVRDFAFDSLRKLMDPISGNLVIKDMSHGKTLAYAQMLVGYFRRRFPDKDIIYFLDNFHKLADWQHLEERIRFKRLSSFVKQEIAERFHCAVFATMEYNKLPPMVRPSNHNLAESVAMEYDSNFIAHLYCELNEHMKAHGHADRARIFHGHQMGIGDRKPTLEMIVGKNKVTSFKGSLWFDFHPASSLFLPVSEETVRRRAAEVEGPEANGHKWRGGKLVDEEEKEEADAIPF